MVPLTHHEILGLVEPFARRGHRVDLAASNRVERCLVFKPATVAARVPALLGASQALRLENPRGDTYRLTRVLTAACGLVATLQAEGKHPHELLTSVEAVPAASQFRSGTGFAMALVHRLEAPAAKSAAVSERLILTHATARVDGLTLQIRVPTMRGIPADIELVLMTPDTLEVPQDLLAVLGWDWARMRRTRQGWSSKLRLRGREPDRSRQAEARLERTVEHLARTLAEPPGHFHDRWLKARWGVVLRRGIPLLTLIGLIAVVVAIPPVPVAQGLNLWVLLFHAPLVLIAISLSLQESSQVEIPPLPRRSTAATWWLPRAAKARDQKIIGTRS
jgi:hypothetical protein